MRSDSADSTSLSLPRRTVLGAGAAVGAGLAAALAAGLGTSQPSQSAPALGGRRRFEGKVVAITGATSGIGRAAAIQFAAEGGKVVFCGRREELGGEVAQQIKDHGGEATYIRADVRNEAEVKNFIDRTVATYGRLDVAFNNAGITLEKPLHEYSSNEWDDVTNTNLRGMFLAMKYEIPYMLAGGGGNIVITASTNAIVGASIGLGATLFTVIGAQIALSGLSAPSA